MKHKESHNNKKHATIPTSPKRRIMRFREFVQSRAATSLSTPAVTRQDDHPHVPISRQVSLTSPET